MIIILQVTSDNHSTIVSKHGTHPFEWIEKGVKDTHRNPWKDISFELPPIELLVAL